jgi:2-(1,2-epoxy-1,2-dihydrophenyl)acetyl-CoA isomerase
MAETLNIQRHGRVVSIELARPDAMNAVDVPMRRELMAAFDELARDPDVGAVVLCAAGRAFCAGADLKSAAVNPDQSLRRTARTLLHDIQPLIECISRMDKPVIAAVNGAAMGVGMSMALACDFIVMADNAYLQSPFINIGLVPDGAAAWFLTRRIGYGRAMEVLVEAQKLSAERCQELGVSNRVVAPDLLRDEALTWAASLAERAPLAMALTKRVARMSMSMGLSEALTMEAELQTFCVSTEDCKEAITAFGEKRKPVFTGR